MSQEDTGTFLLSFQKDAGRGKDKRNVPASPHLSLLRSLSFFYLT